MSLRHHIVALLERDGFDCGICGQPLKDGLRDLADLDVDHIYPKSLGGSDDLDNLRVTHGVCNSRKGAKVPGGWPTSGSGLPSRSVPTPSLRIPFRGTPGTPYTDQEGALRLGLTLYPCTWCGVSYYENPALMADGSERHYGHCDPCRAKVLQRAAQIEAGIEARRRLAKLKRRLLY